MEKLVVVITTYNLKDYIGQAIDSILMQKTNFPFKIIVADDASTDGTVEILLDYQKRYQDKIEVLLTEKNLGSLANSNRVFHKLEFEYFSFLDGDDYWVDENRLQRQVDFLDAHPEFMMCAGNTQYLVDGAPGELLINQQDTGKAYSFQDMVEEKMPFVHTSAILVRNTIFSKGLPDCYVDAVDTFENCALRGEDFRRILHLEQGPMYVMPELVSMYRIHGKGVWQSSSAVHKAVESAVGAHFYAKYFGDKYGDYFQISAQKKYKQLISELLLNGQLMDGCNLEKRDARILSGLVLDMQEHGLVSYDRPYSKLKRFVLKLFLKVIKRIP